MNSLSNLHSLPPSRPKPAVLAPATPSPRKKRKFGELSNGHTPTRSVRKQRVQREMQPLKPTPSNVLAKLSNMSKQSRDGVEDTPRSIAFSEKPSQPIRTTEATKPPTISLATVQADIHINAPKRDDRLALIEELEPGPYEHKAPFDDPHFERFEPHSRMRLKSRSIPHADIQEYLTGRFYVSPSRLYSIVRLLPNRQGYDVPVAGDWVTIAVVAERGEIKRTRAPVSIGHGGEDGDGLEGGPKAPKKFKGKPNPESPGKKYVNIKLIDFGARSGTESSATGGKAVIRGDAFLNLLLFEADGFDKISGNDGKRPQKIYRGGSRGAFEAMSKLKEGDVVALLNPKVLKPFQGSSSSPHPVNNVLAITPESASSIIVIGRSCDLGMCTVTKRDGQLCGSWFDKRVSNVCEYHVQHAVENRRAGRAEFSVCSSGMSTTATVPKRKAAYDPAHQWGLKPEPTEGTGSTYVLSGHIVGGPSLDSRSLFLTESIGREGQAKAQSKMKRVDEDRELQRLLERDKEGMRAVVRAREAVMEMERESESHEGGNKRGKKTRDKKDTGRRTKGPSKVHDGETKTSEDKEQDEKAPSQKSSSYYPASIVKNLGFDPAAVKLGQRKVEDSDLQAKLEALVSSRKDMQLGPRPGTRIRSGVRPPTQLLPNATADDDGETPLVIKAETEDDEKFVDLDDGDSESSK